MIHLFRNEKQISVYCADVLDYIIIKPVIGHLPDLNIKVIAKNAKTLRMLEEIGIPASRWPSFPDIVLMARHSIHKFPDKRIIKIGFRHGAYHFKDFIKSRYYNAFSIYFFTSRTELRQAVERGINSGMAIGFPKIDAAFNGAISEHDLDLIRERLKLDKNKATVILSATWDGSGMSAIDQWANHVSELTSMYNVLITVHPSMSEKYLNHIKSLKKIHLIEDRNILPYLMISDVLISDTSSIIAEFCSLDKPIITFKTGISRKTNHEVMDLISRISFQINSFDELPSAIENALLYPDAHKLQRRECNKIFFDELDGKAGLRAAEAIKQILDDLH